MSEVEFEMEFKGIEIEVWKEPSRLSGTISFNYGWEHAFQGKFSDSLKATQGHNAILGISTEIL